MPAGPLPARSPSPKNLAASTGSPGLRPVAGPPRERIHALLGDLGGRLQPGHALQSAREHEGDPRRHASGLDVVDELLGGGFARGDLGEITGPASSGRTSLLFALLATTTAGGVGNRGEGVAVVDTPDAFDPCSAQAAGVALHRVLWARVGPGREALRCTERLLKTEGLPLVILDIAPNSPSSARLRPEIPASTWTRLARQAATTRTALIVISHQRQVGTEARIVLELQPARAHFSGTPPLLEEIETRAVLVRHPNGGHGRSALVRLGGGFPVKNTSD
jgi:hypothetical protein